MEIKLHCNFQLIPADSPFRSHDKLTYFPTNPEPLYKWVF